MKLTIEIDPLRELPTATGRMLDRCADALGLPEREIIDPTGHVDIMQSDATYRRRLAECLRRIAADIEVNA